MNAVVVQLPERHQPGVVLQRDSVENLQALVRDARDRIGAKDWEELTGLLDELDEVISGYVGAFEG